MSNLGALIKNNFLILIAYLQGKSNRKSFMSALLLLIFGCIAVVGFYSYQATVIFKGFTDSIMWQYAFFTGISTALTVILLVGFMRISNNNSTTDSDLLLSMPLKKSEIILSKTINFYLYDLFFSVALFVPYLVLYQVYAGFSWLTTCLGILTALLLPLLSVGIGYICNFIVSRCFNKSKYSNIFKTIVSVIVFVFVFAFIFKSGFAFDSLSASKVTNLMNQKPVSNLLLKFICNGNGLGFLTLFLITIIPFAVGFLLYIFNFGKSFVGYRSKNKTLKFNEPNKSIFTFIKKELSTYFNTPIYVVNSILGPIFIVALSVAVSSFGFDRILSMLNLTIGKTEFCGVVALLFCGFISLTTISCCSVSLEGKNLWILKSSPVSERKLLNSKAFLNILMVAPLLLICCVIMLFAIKLNFVQFAIVFGVPLLLNVALSYVGLYVNLCFPKLNFANEVEVVKQGMATLIAIMTGMFLVAVPIILNFALAFLSTEIIALICAGIYLIVFIVGFVLVQTKGVKIFRKL